MPNIAYFIDATVVFQKLSGDGGYVVYTRRWLVLAMFVLYSASNAFQWTQLVTCIPQQRPWWSFIAMSGDHHVHPGEVLQHLHPGRLLDQHDLHGSLHPTHLPSIMAPRQKGENPRFLDLPPDYWLVFATILVTAKSTKLTRSKNINCILSLRNEVKSIK